MNGNDNAAKQSAAVSSKPLVWACTPDQAALHGKRIVGYVAQEPDGRLCLNVKCSQPPVEAPKPPIDPVVQAIALITKHGGNKTAIAKALGMSRTSMTGKR